MKHYLFNGEGRREGGRERFGERCHGEKRNMAVGVGLGPKDPSRVCRAQCFVPPTIGQGFNDIRSRLGEGTGAFRAPSRWFPGRLSFSTAR
jgi:hypothetical protein